MMPDDVGNLGTYTAEGITKLCKGLKGSSVTSLSMVSNALCGLTEWHGQWHGTYTNEGIMRLCEGIKGSIITTLNLAFNRIDETGIAALREAFEGPPANLLL